MRRAYVQCGVWVLGCGGWVWGLGLEGWGLGAQGWGLGHLRHKAFCRGTHCAFSQGRYSPLDPCCHIPAPGPPHAVHTHVPALLLALRIGHGYSVFAAQQPQHMAKTHAHQRRHGPKSYITRMSVQQRLGLLDPAQSLAQIASCTRCLRIRVYGDSCSPTLPCTALTAAEDPAHHLYRTYAMCAVRR